jgi:type IX secretion system PorP/SprF family membrane protein
VGTFAYGQSDIFLTQQWFSRINMNPAATGNSNNVDIFLFNRQQWTGFENAPKTSILNAHSYFNGIQSGLGLSLMFDKLGVSHQTVDAMLSYAYHIDLTDNMLLSLGLSGGLYNSYWDPKKNRLNEDDDPEVSSTEKSSRTTADFDAGLELNTYGFTFGASVTHLINPGPEDAYTGKPGREFYVYTRYRRAIDRDFDIAPGIMYRNSNYLSFFDLNVTGWYQKKYWACLSFRPNNAFAVMLGVEFGMFRVGYAYDRSVGVTSSLAANTHEIMLSVRIQKPQKGRKTTRFLE